ncbi:hypothetical protein [Streptomyces sp. TP-A0874]|uniref:hypothetical protein n=1 Tax=Streptomyces sp. TP-A0874 TaxID=549819 RepID=UPI001112EA18|nr:hypothetical protein [Streptomyces sp. TP-A0874]
MEEDLEKAAALVVARMISGVIAVLALVVTMLTLPRGGHTGFYPLSVFTVSVATWIYLKVRLKG